MQPFHAVSGVIVSMTFALALQACSTPEPASDAIAAPDRAGDEAAIENTYNDWVDAANSKDLERWASFTAPDPLFLPPNHPPLRGQATIREFYAESSGELDCLRTRKQDGQTRKDEQNAQR